MMPDDTPGRQVYTPSELNREVRLHLEAGFPVLWLEGEISNLSRPASGHCYFSLKDNQAQVRCVLFRQQAIRAQDVLEDGRQVLVRGRVSLYEPRGDYQLIADHIEAAGAGRLQQMFEELKKKLAAEGLFAPENKRPLPELATRFAIITSPTGAVIRDFLHVLERRWPPSQVRLYASAVQGEQAPGQLIQALAAADRDGWAEILVLARGGGSLEDLWAFNDEQLARAIARCRTPVVSAVGHEADFTIADFAADLRAPTPSAAAELISPDQAAVKERIAASRRRLQRQFDWIMGHAAQRLDHALQRLAAQRPDRLWLRRREDLQRLTQTLQRELYIAHERARQQLLSLRNRLHRAPLRAAWYQRQQHLDRVREQLRRAGREHVQHRQHELTGLRQALEALGPDAVLQRGYALVTSRGDPAHTPVALFRPEQFDPELGISLRFYDFRVAANVEAVEETDTGSREY